MMARMTKPPALLKAAFPDPQKAADRLVPLGWCNQCVGEAKQAEASGAPQAPQISAAVTLILSVQQVPLPQGMSMAVVPLPACWRHIVLSRSSGLLAAAGAVPGVRTG
jgi:hypothetical protein